MNLYQYITSHEEQKNIFVKAQGGAGKTTQLRFIESKLIEHAKKGEKIVPIYIDVKNIDKERTNPIYNEIHMYCGAKCTIDDVKDVFEKVQTNCFKNYKFYILIDAVNEAIDSATKAKIIDDINSLSTCSKCRIIVSSRIEEEGLRNSFQKLTLQPINEINVCSAIERTYKLQYKIQTKKVNQSLLEILQIPLFLLAYLKTFTNETDYSRLYDDKIARKAQILDAYRIKILEDLEPKNRRNTEISDQICFVLNHYLPAVAFQMAKTSKLKLELEDFEDILNSEYFEKFIKGSKKKRILGLIDNNLFNPSAIGAEGFALIIDNEDVWEFSHQIWRDYFCALHIVNVLKTNNSFSELEFYLDENIRRFIGELYINNDGLCECDFETKNDISSTMSPIESVLQNNKDLLNKNPLIIRNLIEISKVSRNNKITMNYNGLNLTTTNFIGSEFKNSLFDNSLISSDSFIQTNKSNIKHIDNLYIIPSSSFFLVIGDENIELWNKKTMNYVKSLNIVDDLYFTINSILAMRVTSNNILIMDKETNVFVFNKCGELIVHYFNTLEENSSQLQDIILSDKRIFFKLDEQLYYKSLDDLSVLSKIQTPKQFEKYIVTNNGNSILLKTKQDVIYMYGWDGKNFVCQFKVSYSSYKRRHSGFHLDDFSLSYDNKYLLVHFYYSDHLENGLCEFEQIEKYEINYVQNHETLLKYITKIYESNNNVEKELITGINIPVGDVSFIDGFIKIEKSLNYFEKEEFFFDSNRAQLFSIRTDEVEKLSNRFCGYMIVYHLTNEELFLYGKEISIARFLKGLENYYTKSHITSLSISSNHRYFVMGKATGEVSIWDLTNCQLADIFVPKMSKIRSAILSNLFDEIIITYKDIDEIFIIDAKTKKIKQRLKIQDEYSWGRHVELSLSLDESMLIVTDYGNIIKTFERKEQKWQESQLLKRIFDIVDKDKNYDNVYVSKNREYIALSNYKKLYIIDLDTNNLKTVSCKYYINDVFIDEARQQCVCISSEHDIIEIIDFSGQISFFDCSIRWYVGENCKAFLDNKTGEIIIVNKNHLEPDSIYDYKENKFRFFKSNYLLLNDNSKGFPVLYSAIVNDKLFILSSDLIKVFKLSNRIDTLSSTRNQYIFQQNIATISTEIKFNAIGSDFSKALSDYNNSYMLFEELYFNGAIVPTDYQIKYKKEIDSFI